MPVFGDGSGIDVEGQLIENAACGYHGEQQFWLPSVCGGVSARLQAGGPDMLGDGREQLDCDGVPWLAVQQRVGLRAASADPCKALGSYCRQWDWDDSESVTDPRQKAPILHRVAARELRKDKGPLDAAGAYRPARGPEEPVCVVLRRDGEQRLLVPVCMVIPVSQDRLPLAELVRRHRGQQGLEHAFQGPLTDLGLQHPPCRSRTAHQGFYLDAQSAPLLLLIAPKVVSSKFRQE